MERLNQWLLTQKQAEKQIQIQFEARGRKEDTDLRTEFEHICNNNPSTVSSSTDFSKIKYHIGFLDKKSNSTGLQLADLVARPIGRHVLDPGQKNQAFEIIKQKFITHDNGRYEERGLKIFP